MKLSQHSAQTLLAILVPSLPFLTSSNLLCRPEGPVVPKPSSLATSPIFQEAVQNLTSALDDALSGAINAGWPDVKNTSFSLAVVSADQGDPGVPLWEYHHLSDANTQGTKEISRDSQYLIGSITKVLSDYILLQSDVDIDAPVTDFLPALNSSSSRIHWQDLTLRMLAAQLAGAPANYGFSEYYYLKEVFLSYGFPPIDDAEYPPCGVTALNEGCSKQQFLDGMKQSYPIAAPMERPAYSNAAFAIFIMALEETTGKNYTQMVRELVAEPLGLQNTLPSPGDDEKAVIPPGDTSWGADYGFNAPQGGLVSSLSDLSKFSHALLARNLSLSASCTREWLKPAAFAGGQDSAVGMPWEILRASDLTPDHPHPVTVYGKGGGALGYRTQMDVVDEYGIALVSLSAGSMLALPYLSGAMLATWVPAVDAISREQAKLNYARSFQSSCAQGSASKVRATITQDTDSLLLAAVDRNGSDLLTGITDIWNFTMGKFAAPIGATVRLFPSDLSQQVNVSGEVLTQEVWRLWPEFQGDNHSDLPVARAQMEACMTWTIGDWVHYGGEPMDRVLFYRDSDGAIVGFEMPFLRSGIMRPS